MKYAQIQALVPIGEHFDESGIINEGGFLSVAHLDNIEQTLATNAPALEQANALIDTHVATIAEKEATITTLQSEKETAQQEVTTQAAKITELQAQVATLSKRPSSRNGTQTITAEDEHHEEKKKSSELPRFDSPDHPANQAAKVLVKQTGK